MADHSAIEWTDATWNPVVGCDRISPGCAHCYAKAIHDRRHKAFLTGGNVLVPQYAQPFEVVRQREARLEVPLHWKKPRRVFVNSMSDLFHEGVPDAFIDRVFAVMALTPQHTYQVLTKRAERMREYVHGLEGRLGELWDLTNQPTWITLPAGRRFPRYPENWPLPNVWLGVSVENQHFADKRIPLLLQTPAAVRFISAEPLLGPVDLNLFFASDDCGEAIAAGPPADQCIQNAGTATANQVSAAARSVFLERGDCHTRRIHHLDWVIIGVEKVAGKHVGRNAEAYEQHARSLLRQCASAGVAAFHKQTPVRNRVSGDPAEWPTDLRVRAYPVSA